MRNISRLTYKFGPGAGDHTPSHICIHVGSEVEEVLGVH